MAVDGTLHRATVGDDSWRPETLTPHPLRVVGGWIVTAVAVYVAAWLVPGVTIDGSAGAFLAAAFIAVFNAVAPPIVAALRLPFTLLLGFVLVLIVDAVALRVAANALPSDISVNSFGDAVLAALVIAAVSIVLQVVLGTNDDDTYRDGGDEQDAMVAHAVSEATGRLDGEDPLAAFSPTAPRHLLRTDGFPHVADIMVGSCYDPALETGCAFEELISFHGGLGGPQTRPFIFHPPSLAAPTEPIIGAAAVHAILTGWRSALSAA